MPSPETQNLSDFFFVWGPARYYELVRELLSGNSVTDSQYIAGLQTKKKSDRFCISGDGISTSAPYKRIFDVYFFRLVFKLHKTVVTELHFLSFSHVELPLCMFSELTYVS